MKVKISSWNINSIRIRKEHIVKFIYDYSPDFISFQEIKTNDGNFPYSFFKENGYKYQLVSGMKSYNGVAIIGKKPILLSKKINFCDKEDARHVSGAFNIGSTEFILHNFYVPAGGEEPNPSVNEKFQHKLDFLDEMKEKSQNEFSKKNSILTSDLNIAPLEHDVWSHKQLENVISHTEIEIKKYHEILKAGKWNDLARNDENINEKIYSWWSYRARDYTKGNRGRRLDHIWFNDLAMENVKDYKCSFHTKYRGYERPSDHVPISVEFSIK